MRIVNLILMMIGATAVLLWLIGTFVPGMNFRACVGPAETCRLAKEPTHEQ